jgi:hypothetical protein
MTSVPEQPQYVWLLCGPGPNRYNDEYNLWEQPARVFSTRCLAMQAVADNAEWLGVQVDWQPANRLQGFLTADLGNDHVMMLCRVPVDQPAGRLACLSGKHTMHRSRASAERCRPRAEGAR